MIDDATRRAILAPRPERKKASVKSNAVFRGISITIVKAILKEHSSWFFPVLVETACKSAISMDVRTTLGLHEELLAGGFVARGATEEDMEVLGRDSYGAKPAHITDKGKSVFKPGTKYMLRTSSKFDPDAPVDLDAYPPQFDLCDATWFNGTVSSSASHPYDPEGAIHFHAGQHADDHVRHVNILTDNNHLSGVEGSRHPGISLDGRRQFDIRYEYWDTSKDSGGELVVRRSFSPGATWSLSVEIESAVPDSPLWSLDGKPGKYGISDDSTVIAVQSVVAVIVGADLWRLAHRRDGLSVQVPIHASIRVGGGDKLEGLRSSLRLLAEEGNAFLSHMSPDQRRGVSVAVD